MFSVTTELAPITHRSPMRDAAGHDDVSAAPDVVTDDGRTLGGEALPGDRPAGIVEAMVGIGDQAAVGEHTVIADLDEVHRGDHHPHG